MSKINKQKHLNIILPLWIPWGQCADFQKKTIEFLSLKHKCFVYLEGDKKYFPKIENKSNLVLFYPAKSPLPFKLLGKTIDKINHTLFKVYIKLQNINVDIVWIFNPEMKNFYQIFKDATLKLFDLVDFAGLNTMYEGISEANLVFVNSHVLRRFALQVADKKVVLVPQGFDQDTYSRYNTSYLPKNIKRNMVTYIGSINFRFDFPLMHKLIQQNPKCHFNLWGPVQYLDKTQDGMYKTQENINILKSYKNVTFGESDRKGLIKLLKESTVAIIPYNTIMDFNRNCFPMKLLEYFYMGLPVLSTSIEEVGRYPGLTFISNNADDWTNVIKHLQKNDWSTRNKTKSRKIAESHSWKNKLGVIEKEIYRNLSFKT